MDVSEYKNSALHSKHLCYIKMQPSHHSSDYDNFGSQGPTDGEDGHETEAEDHKVNTEDDFTRVEQLRGQSERFKVGDSQIVQYLRKYFTGL